VGAATARTVAIAAIATGTAEMPQVILLQDVEQVGEKGMVVEVSKGYARNFLIPRKLAQPATKGALVEAERRTEAVNKAKADATAKAQEGAAALNKTVLTIAHQAGEDGRLFGSITTQDIAEAIQEARGITIDKRKIALDDPIKTVGTHMITVEVADGVTATVKTLVVEQA